MAMGRHGMVCNGTRRCSGDGDVQRGFRIPARCTWRRKIHAFSPIWGSGARDPVMKKCRRDMGFSLRHIPLMDLFPDMD